MKHHPDKFQRRSIRLHGYDYVQPGAYFVTIVTKERACLFGEIINGEMRPNQFACIVQSAWDELVNHYQGVQCDAFMVMPNHIHGIIVLVDDGGVEPNGVGAGLKPARGGLGPAATPRAGFKPAPTQRGLPEILRAFKTFSARRINEIRNTSGVSTWQRNYYEHIVRNEVELRRIREYIANNPLQWEMDRENPLRTSDRLKRKAEAWEV